MDEKSGHKRKRGVFSGREVFYFFFALLALCVSMFVFNANKTDNGDAARLQRNAKFARSRAAARAIAIAGGYVLSETQVLYHDVAGHPAAPWVIYDLKQDAIMDGSGLVTALDHAGVCRDALTNRGYLSGWKGNLVLTTPDSTGMESMIFEWRTGSDELLLFKWADFKGNSGRTSAIPMIAVENGWARPYAYNELGSGRARLVRVGQLIESMPFANRIETNLGKLPIAFSYPFRDELYVTATTPEPGRAGIYIFCLTNQCLVFSNANARMPRAFDRLAAFPDPSGGRVLWMLGSEPGLNTTLRAFLPDAIAPSPAPMSWRFYWSDLRAKKFKFVCTVKNDDLPRILWGVNADSVWLLDGDEGIKRMELK